MEYKDRIITDIELTNYKIGKLINIDKKATKNLISKVKALMIEVEQLLNNNDVNQSIYNEITDRQLIINNILDTINNYESITNKGTKQTL